MARSLSQNYIEEEDIELIESVNYQVEKSDDFYRLGQSIESLVIPENSMNENYFRKLIISGLKNLREIQINNNTFMYVRTCTIDNLPKLNRLMIGEKCFMTNECESEVFYTPVHSQFTLTNCESLTSLTIGDFSFENYTFCKMESENSFSFFTRSS